MRSKGRKLREGVKSEKIELVYTCIEEGKRKWLVSGEEVIWSGICE